MPKRIGEAEWTGNLKEGRGTVGRVTKRPYSFSSRFESGEGTNPEELIGDAHAACFSMALAHALSQAGYKPNRIHTTAAVHVEQVANEFAITKIELQTEADVPQIDDHKFRALAETTKSTCPVSKALAAVKIMTLEAKLLSGNAAQS